MIFIDSGAFLARYVQRDQCHVAATAIWDALANERTPCFTSNQVLCEALTLLARRTRYSFAAVRARHLYSSNANDEAAAIAFFEKFADQRVSFCDCISFALMRRARISEAFTFDRHFAIAGFSIRPQTTT